MELLPEPVNGRQPGASVSGHGGDVQEVDAVDLWPVRCADRPELELELAEGLNGRGQGGSCEERNVPRNTRMRIVDNDVDDLEGVGG